MVLRPIGERALDVLVNGNVINSFTQTSETADYDVSISDNTTRKTIWTGSEFLNHDGTVQTVMETGYTKSNYPSELEAPNLRSEMGIKVYCEGGAGPCTIKLYNDGSNIKNIDVSRETTEWSGWFNVKQSNYNLEKIEINPNVDYQDIFYQYAIRRNVVTGHTVNGVTKS